MNDAIKISHFYYQNLFDNFSLSIPKNQLVTFSGPNNCGKTTLIRILSREVIVDGDIEIEGERMNTYSISSYSMLVGCVIPLEKEFEESCLEEELYLYTNDSKRVDWILRGLSLKSIRRKDISRLSSQEFILCQLAVELVKSLKILLIDDISSYFERGELYKILSFLKKYQKKEENTILYTTRILEDSLYTDYLYIMDEKKISLEGLPLEVLENDTKINKIGLDLPFMVDLSVKLKDYKLLESIELDKNRMVDALWK